MRPLTRRLTRRKSQASLGGALGGRRASRPAGRRRAAANSFQGPHAPPLPRRRARPCLRYLVPPSRPAVPQGAASFFVDLSRLSITFSSAVQSHSLVPYAFSLARRPPRRAPPRAAARPRTSPGARARIELSKAFYTPPQLQPRRRAMCRYPERAATTTAAAGVGHTGVPTCTTAQKVRAAPLRQRHSALSRPLFCYLPHGTSRAQAARRCGRAQDGRTSRPPSGPGRWAHSSVAPDAAPRERDACRGSGGSWRLQGTARAASLAASPPRMLWRPARRGWSRGRRRRGEEALLCAGGF